MADLKLSASHLERTFFSVGKLDFKFCKSEIPKKILNDGLKQVRKMHTFSQL